MRPRASPDLGAPPVGGAGSGVPAETPGASVPKGSGRLARALGLLGPAGVAGGLLAASIPPFGFWPLAPVGFAVLYLRLARQGLRARMAVGFVAAAAWMVPSLWFVTAFTGLGFLAMVVIESSFLCAGAALVPPGRGRALAFPGAVTLAEACRDVWPFGGVPVGGVDLGQAGGWFLPAARIGGHLLLVGLTAAAGVALAEIFCLAWETVRGHLGGFPAAALGRVDRQSPAATPRRRLAAALGASGLAVAAVVAGRLAPAGGPPQGVVSVGAVQGGGPRGLRATEARAARTYLAQLVATERLQGPVDLVVWPEDAIALPRPLTGSVVEAQMGDLARHMRTTLLAGVTVPVGTSQFRNFVAVWGPGGHLLGRYEKVHRVPFGEYVPLRGILSHLVNLAFVPRDAIPGHTVGFMRTPAGPLGVMISYEVFFARPARAAVAAGAELLVVPTNDASYATGQLPSQEVAADRIRAVEEGRELVQSAPTGYSTVVDREGRVLARTSLGRRQTLERTVPRYAGRTLYSLGGDWPERTAAALAVGGGLLLWWREDRDRRRRPARPPGWAQADGDDPGRGEPTLRPNDAEVSPGAGRGQRHPRAPADPRT